MKLTKAQQWLVDQIGDDELRVACTRRLQYRYSIGGNEIARKGLTNTFEALRRNGVIEPASSERRGAYRVYRRHRS